LTESKRSRLQHPLGLFKFDFFKHGELERSKCWFSQRSPYILAEIEQTKAMDAGFCDVEIGTDERDEQ
jgi:hypothetical protein